MKLQNIFLLVIAFVCLSCSEGDAASLDGGTTPDKEQVEDDKESDNEEGDKPDDGNSDDEENPNEGDSEDEEKPEDGNLEDEEEEPQEPFSITMNEETLPQFEGKKWLKVEALSDEFDSWDSTKWNKSLWNYGEPVQMRSENSGVTNGKLWIKATIDTEDPNRWFGTSRVMSKTRIKFPMYTECSMLAAHISGYNTFWLNNGNSDNRDEIDICENNSKASELDQREDRRFTMYSQYFIVKNTETEREHGNFDNRLLSDKNPLKGVAWNEAYHTLGALWLDSRTVQFYLNGEPAGKVTTKQDFTLEQNIIWDLWTVAESWAGGIADRADIEDGIDNTMFVDWIHTYELVNL